jgi:hypothetical protein
VHVVTMDNERIDELVRRAAPTTPFLSGPALREIAAEVISTPAAAEQPIASISTLVGSRERSRSAQHQPGRRGWRRRRVVLPLAAATALLAAAAGFTVWYDTTTADFEQALQRYSSELSLPPGTDRDAYVAQLRAQGLERPLQISEEGVNSMVSHYGACTWLKAWQVRTDAKDTAGAKQALETYRRAIASPALKVNDGGGVVANLERVADAAAAGNRARVAQELKNNCSSLPSDGIR